MVLVQMRMLCTIVPSSVLAILHARQDLTFRWPVALPCIGNDHVRDALQLAVYMLRNCLISALVP